jgi:hypothetical protein
LNEWVIAAHGGVMTAMNKNDEPYMGGVVAVVATQGVHPVETATGQLTIQSLF